MEKPEARNHNPTTEKNKKLVVRAGACLSTKVFEEFIETAFIQLLIIYISCIAWSKPYTCLKRHCINR
jgi:hypothetical protein